MIIFLFRVLSILLQSVSVSLVVVHLPLTSRFSFSPEDPVCLLFIQDNFLNLYRKQVLFEMAGSQNSKSLMNVA